MVCWIELQTNPAATNDSVRGCMVGKQGILPRCNWWQCCWPALAIRLHDSMPRQEPDELSSGIGPISRLTWGMCTWLCHSWRRSPSHSRHSHGRHTCPLANIEMAGCVLQTAASHQTISLASVSPGSMVWSHTDSRADGHASAQHAGRIVTGQAGGAQHRSRADRHGSWHSQRTISKPSLQLHSQPPWVLVQVWSQPEVPSAHSSTSWQATPSPLKPAHSRTEA